MASWLDLLVDRPGLAGLAGLPGWLLDWLPGWLGWLAGWLAVSQPVNQSARSVCESVSRSVLLFGVSNLFGLVCLPVWSFWSVCSACLILCQHGCA